MSATELSVSLPGPAELAGIAGRIAKMVARPSVPVLGGVLLTATEHGGLRMDGYDYERALSRTADAKVAEPGVALVSAKLLADVAKALPAKPVTLTVDDAQRLRVDCGAVHARLPLMPSEDYPQRPALPPVLGECDAAELAAAVAAVAHAGHAAEELGLDGVHLALTEHGLVLAATDRYRLAQATVGFTPALNDNEGRRLLRVEVATLLETIKTATGTVILHGDDNLVGLHTSTEQVLLRQLSTKGHPDFDSVIARAAGTAASVEVADLAAALRRAQVYRPESSVVVDVADDTMTVTTSSPQVGENTETLPVTGYTGPPARFGINPDYLATALSALGGTTADLAVPATARTPMALRPGEQSENGQVQIVMPVRLPEELHAAA